MLKNSTIKLRTAHLEDKEPLFNLLTSDEEWTKFNGPYFSYSTPTLEAFEKDLFKRLQEGREALVIDYLNKPVGSVTYYWEDERTRWLEVGICIYAHSQWGKGLGQQALQLWVTHLFQTHDIERVGLTTWSGNPRMIACAQAIGMQIEGRIRKVRYFQGEYYDSVKLGVLREEWFQ